MGYQVVKEFRRNV